MRQTSEPVNRNKLTNFPIQTNVTVLLCRIGHIHAVSISASINTTLHVFSPTVIEANIESNQLTITGPEGTSRKDGVTACDSKMMSEKELESQRKDHGYDAVFDVHNSGWPLGGND